MLCLKENEIYNTRFLRFFTSSLLELKWRNSETQIQPTTPYDDGRNEEKEKFSGIKCLFALLRWIRY